MAESPPPEPTGRNLVLTGFMGTGKTTVARLAAERLGYELVDTDELIEARHGPIAGIFATSGENAFREMEREVARELAELRALVISTGGRMMLDPEIASVLEATGTVICLVASPEVILERVGGPEAGRSRPLLAGPDPLERIVTLLAERESGYARFTRVDTDGLTAEQVADEVVALYRAG
jgi:shikimate kinase